MDFVRSPEVTRILHFWGGRGHQWGHQKKKTKHGAHCGVRRTRAWIWISSRNSGKCPKTQSYTLRLYGFLPNQVSVVLKVPHETSKREVYEDVKLFTYLQIFHSILQVPQKKTFIKLKFLNNRLFHFSKAFWEILSLGKAQSCQKPTVIILNKSSFSEFVFFSWINNLTTNFGKQN